MTAYRNVNGTFRTCPAVYQNLGGTWRNVVAGWRNVGGTWRQFFSNAPTVAINPQNSYGHSQNQGTVSGSALTAQVNGGSGSFTYAWSKQAGSDSRITITSPSSATTGFTASLRTNDEADAMVTCVVTDTVTGQATSGYASIQLQTGTPN